MFTGIINGCGIVHELYNHDKEIRLIIKPLFTIPNIIKGESIAINGVCLTVEKFINNTFTVYVSPTTIQKTNLGKLKHGDTINLERSLNLGDRMGGHLVTGHVDCIATVMSIKKQGESHYLRFKIPTQFSHEVVSKGSIALNGISLTVVDCGTEFLDVTIIPTTWEVTNIPYWRIGTLVNMETDIIGKYVYKMLTPFLTSKQASSNNGKTLNLKFLQEHGFF